MYCIYTVDTETTGLDYQKHEIIELSMSRLLPDEEEGFRKEQKSWFIKPLNPETIDDDALAVNGHKRADLLHQTQEGRDLYLLPDVVVRSIDRWLMDDDVSSADRIFFGMNPQFDYDFVKEFYRRHSSLDALPFNCEKGNRLLDLKDIVLFFDICVGKRRKGYNLTNIAKSLGTKKEKAHRADADVRMTEATLLKLMAIASPSIKSDFLPFTSEE